MKNNKHPTDLRVIDRKVTVQGNEQRNGRRHPISSVVIVIFFLGLAVMAMLFLIHYGIA
jgi:hypothetical protein